MSDNPNGKPGAEERKTVVKKLYIRADGNSEIGMGHVMRCISIGEAVRRLSVCGQNCTEEQAYSDGGETCRWGECEAPEVHFLLAGEQAVAAVERAGFPYTVLHTDYQNMESEIPLLEKILQGEAKVFLVDSYYVTPAYLQYLRTKGKVAYVDDVNAFSYPVDAIINGNVYGAEMEYELFYSHTEVWGGLRFSPLRGEYALHRGKRKEEYILVTTGSSDPHHLAEKIVGELLRANWTKQEKICVVCGQFSQSMEQLRRWEQEDERLMVKCNVPDMWNAMNGAKLAITAGGSTMNELACMGVPMIGFSFVDNQERIARIYREKDYSHYGGNYLLQGDGMISEICRAAEELCADVKLRNAYSERLMEQVDGEGSKRLAERLFFL